MHECCPPWQSRYTHAVSRQPISAMPDNHSKQAAADPSLRRVMKWVFAALIATVVLAILVVEFTLRWLGER